MEMQYFKEYSPALGREMECKVYGHGGRPMLYIPCQDGRFFDFEDFHMADTRHRLRLQPRRDPCGQPLPPLARHLLRLSGPQRHLHRPLRLRRLHG